jgi:hypothetical protein
MASIDDLLQEAENEENQDEIYTYSDSYLIYEDYISDYGQIEIIKKEIQSLENEISISGEMNSQYVEFILDRYSDNVDLSNMTFHIGYTINNKSDEDRPINVRYSNKHIILDWLISGSVTNTSGALQIGIWANGTLHDNDFVWKTKIATYTIVNGLAIGGEIIEPDENWYLQFTKLMDSKVEYVEKQVSKIDDIEELAEKVEEQSQEILKKYNDATEKANKVSEDLQSVEQVKVDVEQIKADTQQIKAETENTINTDLETAKEEIEQIKTETGQIKIDVQNISDEIKKDVSDLAHLSGAEFTGDVKFPTPNEDVNDTTGATTEYVQNAITKALSGITKIDIKIVDELPILGVTGTFYFVPNDGTGNNIYNEYLWANDAWELLGTTEIDLTGYAKLTDVETSKKTAVETANKYTDEQNKSVSETLNTVQKQVETNTESIDNILKLNLSVDDEGYVCQEL